MLLDQREVAMPTEGTPPRPGNVHQRVLAARASSHPELPCFPRRRTHAASHIRGVGPSEGLSSAALSLTCMRAVQITRFGGPEVMDIVDLPAPTPGPGQQLYEVSSAGVNFADT